VKAAMFSIVMTMGAKITFILTFAVFKPGRGKQKQVTIIVNHAVREDICKMVE
jgi:hypothetical protein